MSDTGPIRITERSRWRTQEAARLRARGFTWALIGLNLGMSAQGAQSAARRPAGPGPIKAQAPEPNPDAPGRCIRAGCSRVVLAQDYCPTHAPRNSPVSMDAPVFPHAHVETFAELPARCPEDGGPLVQVATGVRCVTCRFDRVVAEAMARLLGIGG